MTQPINPYVPAPVPADSKLLGRYLTNEFARIAAIINGIKLDGANGQFLPVLDTSPVSATTGTAATLPAKPAGYAEVKVNGNPRRLPFYLP